MDDLPSPPNERLLITSSTLFAFASLVLFIRACVPRTNSADILRRLSDQSTKTRWRIEGLGLALCYVLLVGFTTCMLAATIQGLGYSQQVLSSDEVEAVSRWRFLANIFYVAHIYAAKMLLVTIFARIWYSVRFFWVLFGTLGLAWLGFVLIAIFACVPVNASWTMTGRCLNPNAIGYATVGTDLAFDFILMGLPILYLWSLEFNRRKGLGLILMYLIGLTIAASGACQLYYLASRVSRSNDLTRDATDQGLWRTVEANLSLCLCCMPGMARIIEGKPKRQAVFTEKPDFKPRLYNTITNDSTVSPSYRTSKITRSSKGSSWRSSIRISKGSSWRSSTTTVKPPPNHRTSYPFFDGLFHDLTTVPAPIHPPTLNQLKIPSPNISPLYDAKGNLKSYKRQTIISWSPFARTASSNLIDLEAGEKLIPEPASTACRHCHTRLHPSACICMISRPHTVHESQRVGHQKLWRIDEEAQRRSKVYHSWPEA